MIFEISSPLFLILVTLFCIGTEKVCISLYFLLNKYVVLQNFLLALLNQNDNHGYIQCKKLQEFL